MNHSDQTTPARSTLGKALPEQATLADMPQRIGRYRVQRILGQGSFGIVYLADDEQLQRRVAIKVPHRALVRRPEEAEPYLREARVAASLDHPHIVPVFDAGASENYPCFIVSKYIEGCTLARRIKDDRPSLSQAVDLVATLAEALQHAHRRGLVHRDIKPANILLDTAGKAHIADFGLALRESEGGQAFQQAGTPAYMCPEQARGEGHRVDGRSDIFSLGVIFYQLLTGQLPFRADSKAELMELIATVEPRPPRQIEDGIPEELERICLKALAKRAAERYATAQDMADDLQHFFLQDTVLLPSASAGRAAAGVVQTRGGQVGSTANAFTPSETSSKTPQTLASEGQLLRIVPKGLRSFDAHDADFFLELLPGPRDREGLPDSIRFWKTRIEETDADNTFSVGVIYGPSGCGKSSLVKAGLLPRLSAEVIAVYIEATKNDTEIRLLNGLRKHCPELPANLGLKETLAALRLGPAGAGAKKILLVLDQFEQWLHARKDEPNTELVQALRQCDGGRVQCLVLVRDDFWMALIRCLRELEIELVQGRNFAAADLFDLRHARKVLTAFGQAFGTLPEDSKELTREQKDFLERTVSGLTEEGKIICVRLALFAEMMKGKPWTPASFKAVGGTEGVGVTFLEETFSSPAASPRHRLHQLAARAVLRVLLPESGTDIKGHMRAHTELQDASGYAGRARDFDDLMQILDGELRLITPTDPAGNLEEGSPAQALQAGQRYYQLTHDYLVPSLRDWLTRKQKETRRGRAELLLADRASVWNARPENRQLPSLPQWLGLRFLTQKNNWTETQRKMMRRAGRYHSLRVLTAAGLLLAACLTGLGIRREISAQAQANHAAGLVQQLLVAGTPKAPEIVDKIEAYRAWADPLLRAEHAKAADRSHQKLHTSLALLPVDPGQVQYLLGRLLDADPQAVSVIEEALFPHRQQVVDKLWAVAERPDKGAEHQRLRAACALASFDPLSPRWAQVQAQIADDLVAEPAVYLATWMDCFRPISDKLRAPLEAVYRDSKRREIERSLATDILVDYAADQPKVLADLLMDADDKQFNVLYPKVKGQEEFGLAVLESELGKRLPAAAAEEVKEALARRQANAAVALLRMDRPEEVWPLLAHSRDPRVRSYLIHRFSPLGVDAAVLVKREEVEPDITIRRSLLLSLGGYGEKELAPTQRAALLDRLRDVYGTAADAGLHGAVEWLLREWHQDKWLGQKEDQWATDTPGRRQRLEGIKANMAKDRGAAQPQWYVNGQGQTMAVIPGPREFEMGSPPAEAGRLPTEQLHLQRIERTFAIATKPVTVAQFLRFRKDAEYFERFARTPDCPVNRVTWYMAAEYCNWLSRQEGLLETELCYEPNKDGKYEEGMKLVPHYLQRSGYRLPMEAEWECACRAGALTSRHYGQSEALLGMYAWYIMNSAIQNHLQSHPVGTRKPNDWGLFDMHGNLYNWCQDLFPNTGPKAPEDNDTALTVLSKDNRAVRGSAFGDLPQDIRAANRQTTVPSQLVNYAGFRLARTIR